MPSYKGEYAPEDQREVTLNTSDLPIEPERTGPQESSTRGDPREQDISTEAVAAQQAGAEGVVVGELSNRPDLRARADANPAVPNAS